MARSIPGTDAFSVQGNIFDVVTKQGIGNLLVTIYNVDQGADRAASSTLAQWLEKATRVGSVLSDEAGLFSFQYDKDDILARGAENRRLDLLVVISAPEDETTAAASKVLYYSNPPRMNAGRVENFNIGITRDTQRKFGLNGETNIKESLGSYERHRTGEKELNQGIVDFHRGAIERDIAGKGGLCGGAAEAHRD